MSAPASLTQLEELLGYERYVLRKCAELNGHLIADESPEYLIINDALPHERQFGSECSISAADVSAATQEMAPLIFCAAYKVLDMIIEWTLENDSKPRVGRMTFEYKCREAVSPELVWPGLLDSEPLIRERLIGFYVSLVEYRNAIVHGKWGENRGGTLHFSFEKRAKSYAKTVAFREVLRFGEVLASVADFLLHPSTFTNRAGLTLLSKLNELTLLHGKAPAKVVVPRLFHVTRKTQTGFPVRVDVENVRSFVASISPHRPFEVELRVQAETQEGTLLWRIPAQNLPETNFTLDGSWERFAIGRGT